MSSITIREEKNIIVFFDKTTKIITKKQADALLVLSTKKDTFTLDGGLYKFSAIAKIIPLEEYYQEYPDKRPASTTYYTPKNETTHWTKDTRRNAIEGMLKGIESFISKNPNSPNAIAMRETMQKRLNDVLSGSA